MENKVLPLAGQQTELVVSQIANDLEFIGARENSMNTKNISKDDETGLRCFRNFRPEKGAGSSLCGLAAGLAAVAVCSCAPGSMGSLDGGSPTNPEGGTVLSGPIVRLTSLVSDQLGLGTDDPSVVNPWGLAFAPTAGIMWVANNHTGLSTSYDATGLAEPLVVTIPAPSGATGPAAPTGILYNGSADFMGDKWIFATEDGTIAGWQSGSKAILRVDQSALGAVYKGLTTQTTGGVNYLYAANFQAGRIDVFDRNYGRATLPGSFTDPSVPAGFAPFNIQSLGGLLYVTYAKQTMDKHDDVPGAGNGYVAVFSPAGQLQQHLISAGLLNSPWGLALVPAGFGPYGGALLIGNFGDGNVNLFLAATGEPLGLLRTNASVPLTIPGLWAVSFGNDTGVAAHNQIFFTSGPAGETHGTIGRLDLVP